MNIHPIHTDRTNCPCCGPDTPTVADALAATSDERLAATTSRLAFRPIHDVARDQAVLVEVATDQAVVAWCGHEARALADEVLAGPYGATLCLETPAGRITFAKDALVALAVALHHVADELHAPRQGSVVDHGHGFGAPRPNRAMRRAGGRHRR